MHTSDRHFIPVTNPPPTSAIIHPPPELKSLVLNPNSLGQGPWDGWPDGKFHHDFNLDEYRQSDNLKIHWATKALGGDRTGDEHAPTLERERGPQGTVLVLSFATMAIAALLSSQ